MTLFEYFMVPFKSGARGPTEFDCWGWVRAVRHDVYGKQLMPEFPGVTNRDLTAMHDDYESVLNSNDYDILDSVDKVTPGTVVAVLRGGRCVHIGIIVEVDGVLYYADIGPSGCRRMTIPDMLEHYRGNYHRLVYADDYN